MIWLAAALLTFFVAVFAVAPLLRSARAPFDAAQDSTPQDVAFYESQLAEIARDAEAGLLPEGDAETAKVEAARRLLAAAQFQQSGGGTAQAGRSTALAAALFISVFSFALYASLGAPEAQDQPLSARQSTPIEKMDIETALAKVEGHLAANPDDGRGWEVVGPVYMRLGRADDAVHAFSESLRLNGESPDRLANYGEALIFAADGVVTAQARSELEKAEKLDQRAAKPRYYLGLAAAQDGDKARAKEIWTKLAHETKPGSALAASLRQRLADLDGAPPAPANAGPQDESQAAAIAGMKPADREATIRSMVDRLAERLKTKGDDPDGWLRLVRAYSVLKEDDKARAALADARKAVGADPAASARLDALARELGLEG